MTFRIYTYTGHAFYSLFHVYAQCILGEKVYKVTKVTSPDTHYT